ncbi:MAG TPA: hypothetical protein VHD81_00670 [Mycobacteriales bacterium]|nr:hypothetical protein [Mycobacteriales bacterium]
MAVRNPSLAAIRRASGGPSAEGMVRLMFVRDGGRIGLVQTPSELADGADQFFALYLERMITDVAAPGVVVAIHRIDGRPSHSDRRLWTMLGERLAATSSTLLDLVAVGPDRVWSAKRGGPLKPPRRRAPRAKKQSPRSAARRSASRAAAR